MEGQEVISMKMNSLLTIHFRFFKKIDSVAAASAAEILKQAGYVVDDVGLSAFKLFVRIRVSFKHHS